MQFGMYLLTIGRINAAQLAEAVRRQMHTRPMIGNLAVEQEMLTPDEVQRVLGAQTTTHAPFGELAIEMGLLSQTDVNQLLALQVQRTESLGLVLVETGAMTSAELEDEMRAFHLFLGMDSLTEFLPATRDVDAIEAAFASYAASA